MKKMIFFIFLLSISTTIMGIGYAAINNVALELGGSTTVKKIDYIKITKVDYKSDVLANLEESKINNYYMTTINSRIVLGDDSDSSISYDITLKNDTDKSFKYVDAIHDDSAKFYDNGGIEYEVTGIKKGDLILPENEKIITITFKYKNASIEDTVLNSYINIKFSKVFNIDYVNIDGNNLINSIAEEEISNIEFSDPPVDLDIVGELDYEYVNGVLSISNVESDIKIIGKSGISLYSVIGENVSIGSIINPINYQNTISDIIGAYIKYTIDSNNKIVKVEVCKDDTSNAGAICIIAIDPGKYSANKQNLIEYFGGNSNDLPSECNEEDNNKFTCNNQYVVLSVDSKGGTLINDLENSKSCQINPSLDIYLCK